MYVNTLPLEMLSASLREFSTFYYFAICTDSANSQNVQA